ncbi:hypothetical protein [Flavobacterium psychrotolerans]|uniref:Uncharacterized protein n=1 Tax=Flavobacterium psychrotolerans TaxID=2169410 RepID=A0A2U1JHS7_9FLAO|nr:hypothetical protein [Flavobacterium psychrotolerans]PWA04730.1 hypothetical protein DB895_09585 [Flavobacterium psychrotolerans]
MDNSFQIFKPDNKTFHWDINNILLLLLLIAGFFKILNLEYISKIAGIIIFCIILLGIIMILANLFRKKPLNGVLNGTITFNSDNICINDEIIKIQSIKKIFLRLDDYDGKNFGITGKASLFPKLSNGTNNLLDLDLTDGVKRKLFFKMNYEMQYEVLKPFIISLFRNNIMTFEKAIEILKIEDDHNIEKFKTELNRKELE